MDQSSLLRTVQLLPDNRKKRKQRGLPAAAWPVSVMLRSELQESEHSPWLPPVNLSGQTYISRWQRLILRSETRWGGVWTGSSERLSAGPVGTVHIAVGNSWGQTRCLTFSSGVKVNSKWWILHLKTVLSAPLLVKKVMNIQNLEGKKTVGEIDKMLNLIQLEQANVDMTFLLKKWLNPLIIITYRSLQWSVAPNWKF